MSSTNHIYPLRMTDTKTCPWIVFPRPEALAIERKMYNGLFTTKDRREGLEAFSQKRKPVYVGR